MRRVISVLVLLAGTSATMAGVPRDFALSADEQIADDATGITIARGRAEFTAGKGTINGRADVIEVRPAENAIKLIGGAVLTVRSKHFESDTVTCTLDFVRCADGGLDQSRAASPAGSATTSPE